MMRVMDQNYIDYLIGHLQYITHFRINSPSLPFRFLVLVFKEDKYLTGIIPSINLSVTAENESDLDKQIEYIIAKTLFDLIISTTDKDQARSNFLSLKSNDELDLIIQRLFPLIPLSELKENGQKAKDALFEYFYTHIKSRIVV